MTVGSGGRGRTLERGGTGGRKPRSWQEVLSGESVWRVCLQFW